LSLLLTNSGGVFEAESSDWIAFEHIAQSMNSCSDEQRTHAVVMRQNLLFLFYKNKWFLLKRID